jgi:hypothetical protein
MEGLASFGKNRKGKGKKEGKEKENSNLKPTNLQKV